VVVGEKLRRAQWAAVAIAAAAVVVLTVGYGRPPWIALLLAGGGIATAVPLMLFGAAAVRIPLTTIGLLQYGSL
jgi:EamA domain-containing membrane protein RarD